MTLLFVALFSQLLYRSIAVQGYLSFLLFVYIYRSFCDKINKVKTLLKEIIGWPEYFHIYFLVDMEEKIEASGLDYLESPVSDGTIEENFEEELVNAPVITPGVDSLSYPFVDDETEEDFSEVAKYGIVEVVGDDTYGRKVIVVSACKLPGNKELDHALLLR
jgi:hypothetical protein